MEGLAVAAEGSAASKATAVPMAMVGSLAEAATVRASLAEASSVAIAVEAVEAALEASVEVAVGLSPPLE